MEFPDLGAHCSMPLCNKLDFLPVRCDCCKKVFCYQHMRYDDHLCPKAGAKNVQVPICPLCNKPVPSKRDETPDIAVSAHIDRDCESDPAVGRRKVYTNKCTMRGCRKKEVVPFICSDCRLNFCVTHRHPADHGCYKKLQLKKKNLTGSQKGSKPISTSEYESYQGNMDEDEALARALAISYEETKERNEDSASSSLNRNNESVNCTLS